MAFTSSLFTILLCASIISYIEEVSSSCTTGSDGLSFDCESSISGTVVSFKIEIEACREHPKVKVSLKVAALDIDFHEEFVASQDIPIPGFAVASVGVYLRVEMDTKSNGILDLKLQLTLKAFISLITVTVLDEPIAKTDCSDIEYWWNSQGDAIKAAVTGAPAVLIVIFICCCCCCCKRKKSQPSLVMTTGAPAVINPSSNQSIQMTAPSYYPPSNTAPLYYPSSNIPYKKQVNEPM